MANVLDPMDIKQIFSLHRDGLSNRKIASVLNISRNTINTFPGLKPVNMVLTRYWISMRRG